MLFVAGVAPDAAVRSGGAHPLAARGAAEEGGGSETDRVSGGRAAEEEDVQGAGREHAHHSSHSPVRQRPRLHEGQG